MNPIFSIILKGKCNFFNSFTYITKTYFTHNRHLTKNFFSSFKSVIFLIFSEFLKIFNLNYYVDEWHQILFSNTNTTYNFRRFQSNRIFNMLLKYNALQTAFSFSKIPFPVLKAWFFKIFFRSIWKYLFLIILLMNGINYYFERQTPFIILDEFCQRGYKICCWNLFIKI